MGLPGSVAPRRTEPPNLPIHGITVAQNVSRRLARHPCCERKQGKCAPNRTLLKPLRARRGGAAACLARPGADPTEVSLLLRASSERGRSDTCEPPQARQHAPGVRAAARHQRRGMPMGIVSFMDPLSVASEPFTQLSRLGGFDRSSVGGETPHVGPGGALCSLTRKLDPSSSCGRLIDIRRTWGRDLRASGHTLGETPS